MNSMSGQKLKGIPYTGTLPATITGTKAGYLHRYKVYGNTEQTGTPTPENPIVPSECGEMTENLYNKTDSSMNFIGYVSNVDYTVYASSSSSFSIIVPVEPNTTYTIVKPKTSRFRVGLFTTYPYVGEVATAIYGDRDGNGVDYGTSLTFTTSNDTSYILAFIRNYTDPETTNEQMKNSTMVLEGSTAPTSYIPFGYKLPLTSAGQDVDIYLGESQTIRWIKKLVLTGQETISGMADANDGAKAVSYTYSALGMTDIINNERGMNAIPYPIYLSSHFKEKTSGYSSWLNINAGEIGANSVQSNTVNRYLIFGTSEQTQADFKAYLAAQYAAGTPVTVWYVLATPTTSTINEPLRKIGNYADTIDSTQTTAQIPTSSGSTTISWAGSGLAPSQFDSIQEWVDIPTYKRVNGEWVADN